MFNAKQPEPSELPSTNRLLKSTGIAAVLASALLVLVVLPAEYGVDPTGAGSLLGLTEMGRIKMQLAEEAAADAAADAAATSPSTATAPTEQMPPAPVVPQVEPASPPTAAAPQVPVPGTQQITASPTATAKDESVFTLAPDEGFEIKLVMEKGAKAQFEWFTDGPGVNYDTHADGEGIKYHGYAKGSNTPRQSGELVAAFKGQHGWFWRNRTDDDVVVTLRTSGEYSDLKEYD